jgi:hypothetical protein
MTPLIKHNVAVGDSSPVIDLDPMAGIQSSSSVATGIIQIATGVAFDAFNCIFKIKKFKFR